MTVASAIEEASRLVSSQGSSWRRAWNVRPWSRSRSRWPPATA